MACIFKNKKNEIGWTEESLYWKIIDHLSLRRIKKIESIFHVFYYKFIDEIIR